jgi:hypothetical protein
MFRLTKQINVAIPCGLYLPHGAFYGIFLPCLGRLKGGTIRPCLSYLASFFLKKINQREYDTMVSQH